MHNLTYQVELLRKERLLSPPARKNLQRIIGADYDPVDVIVGRVDPATDDVPELFTSSDEEAKWLAACHYWEKRRLEEIESYSWVKKAG